MRQTSRSGSEPSPTAVRTRSTARTACSNSSDTGAISPGYETSVILQNRHNVSKLMGR